MKHNKKTIQKIAEEVEKEFGMGGLAVGLYLDFATEVAIKYADSLLTQKTKTMNKEIKKVSSEWIKEVGYEIINPDGWDRNNYEFSFNKEKITEEEFKKRLSMSTVNRKVKF